jgi:hypothetical protein
MKERERTLIKRNNLSSEFFFEMSNDFHIITEITFLNVESVKFDTTTKPHCVSE